MQVELYEKSAELGGMCRTFQSGAHRYDSGAHRFHDRDPEVTRDVRELLRDDLVPVAAPSQIHDRGRFIDFPPTPLNLVMSSGLLGAGRIAIELLHARMQRSIGASFADFAVHQFGRTLARRLLLDYSEKVWGLPADQLSADIATRRLQGMTLRSLLVELLAPSRKSTHIDGAFLYPRNGYGQIADALCARIPAQALHRGFEVSGLELDRGRVRRIRFASDVTHVTIDPGDRLVSTLPLPLLVKLIGEGISPVAVEAARRLRFRHLRLVWLRLACPQVSPNASIYVPDPRFCISRVYEPKNRSIEMSPPGETSLVVEVPCFLDDPIEKLMARELVGRVVDELSALRLIERAQVVESVHHFLANAYPVYSLDYASNVLAIRDALRTIENLDTLGRSGEFIYSHLHDQLRFAKDYVRTVTMAGPG
jgi:protoporphyrinogen oxidase